MEELEKVEGPTLWTNSILAFPKKLIAQNLCRHEGTKEGHKKRKTSNVDN